MQQEASKGMNHRIIAKFFWPMSLQTLCHVSAGHDHHHSCEFYDTVDADECAIWDLAQVPQSSRIDQLSNDMRSKKALYGYNRVDFDNFNQ